MIVEPVDTTSRQSKYCAQIEQIIQTFGHASNAQILQALQKTYPDLSATTVHRATARLANRRKIGVAPNDTKGAMRYDANTNPHDHFVCSECGILKDIDVASEVAAILAKNITDCGVSGRLTIGGICKTCKEEGGV